MKKNYINRNYFWADLFVNQLVQHGVRSVCLSPGSRNTPLTIAFASNTKFKKYVHADERSSGFFALGLSKFNQKPVAVVTTSGTAVAELYPAIIEAYYQRIKLIICTADRPSYLRDTGANQTINQTNIFGNHIRYYKDVGLPSLNEKKLKSYVSQINKGIKICQSVDRGPVHFNFPFKKPLEPSTYSDDIKFSIEKYLLKKNLNISNQLLKGESKRLVSALDQSDRPLIHCGWGTFNSSFYKKIFEFSEKSKIPILADGSANIRFIKKGSERIISNHSSFLNYLEKDSDLIIQFGNAPTSSHMLKYLENTRAKRFLINEFGDLKDPSRKKGFLIKNDPSAAVDSLMKTKRKKSWGSWSEKIAEYDRIAELAKSKIGYSEIENESRIMLELINGIPENSNIFISNSLPIRDFDTFASRVERNYKIFVNRGASGIDGIISTASGIAAESKQQTYLIIGDLAFYHNISALSTLKEYDIRLRIVLINNSGGNIFRMLPVEKEIKYFEKYFLASQDLDYKNIVASFGGKYYSAESWRGFHTKLREFSNAGTFSVMEFITDPVYSANYRRDYLAEVKKIMIS